MRRIIMTVFVIGQPLFAIKIGTHLIGATLGIGYWKNFSELLAYFASPFVTEESNNVDPRGLF